MSRSGDIGTLPVWLKLLLLIAGAVLMLTAADVIPADPARFKTPQWVLFVAAHSERHTKQINEVKADPNFPKK